MGNTNKPDVSAEEVQQAQNLWASFTKFLTWATAATIVCLILLAITMV